jgi:hypothetical protein
VTPILSFVAKVATKMKHIFSWNTYNMSPLPAIYVVYHTDELDTIFKFTLPTSHVTQDVYRHFQKRIVSSVLTIPRCDIGYDHIYPLNYFIYGARYPNRITEHEPQQNDRPGDSVQIIYTSNFMEYHKHFQVFMIQSLDDVLPVDEIGNEFMSMKLTYTKIMSMTVPESWKYKEELEEEWMNVMYESINQTYA